MEELLALVYFKEGVILINHIQFGQGKDILFLHGWGGSIDSFMGLGKSLSNRFRVTLIDFYGFGKTPHPAKPLMLNDYVESVLEIIKQYDMHSINIIAHSFGGRVAIKLTAKYEYLCEKLVLIDSAGLKPRRTIKYYYRVIRHRLLKLLKIPHKAGSKDYQQLSPIMKKTFVNVVNENLYHLLGNITTPTLIIWGNKDKETPIYMARKLNKKIVGSGLVVLNGAGHYSYLEQPTRVLLILNSFLLEG